MVSTYMMNLFKLARDNGALRQYANHLRLPECSRPLLRLPLLELMVINLMVYSSNIVVIN